MKCIRGLALSGGGARGWGHLGALKALDEANALNTVKHISGSSVGSLVGALLVAGYSPSEMITLASAFVIDEFYDVDLSSFSDFGICAGKKLREFMTHALSGKSLPPQINISDLSRRAGISLIVSAYNLNEGKTVYFDSDRDISVADAIACSCAIPGLFPSPEIDGCRYIDGAIFDFLPLTPLTRSVPTQEILGISLAASLKPRLESFPTPESFFQRILDCAYDHVCNRSVVAEHGGPRVLTVYDIMVPADSNDKIRVAYKNAAEMCAADQAC